MILGVLSYWRETMNTKAMILVLIVPVISFAGNDLATVAMESTFKLVGNSSMGTCFIVGRPIPNKEAKLRFVLVTAKHVLKQAKGEMVVIHLRKKSGDSYTRLPHSIRIRQGQTALWVEHRSADVAAMYVALPKAAHIRLISSNLFANDDILKKFEVRPGDQLYALGYPFGQESNQAGFSILRTGTVASYPLLPTANTKSFLFDFEIYKGNSGGPVLFISHNRVYGGGTHPGTVNFMIGLVSSERILQEKVKSLYETREERHTLKLAQIVHASLIRETIDKLQNKGIH